MKNIPVYSSLLTALLIINCSKPADDGDYIEWPSETTHQRITAKTSSSISFIAQAAWGNSCGSFSRSLIIKTDSTYVIKIFGKQPKSAICLAVMSSFDAPVTINIPSSGTYTFKFWQSDSTSIDTTLTIQ